MKFSLNLLLQTTLLCAALLPTTHAQTPATQTPAPVTDARPVELNKAPQDSAVTTAPDAPAVLIDNSTPIPPPLYSPRPPRMRICGAAFAAAFA